MAPPSLEIPKEQLDSVRPIAERAKANPAQFAEDIKGLTEVQLNALMAVLREPGMEALEQQRQVVLDRSQKLRESLDTAMVDQNLDRLASRPAEAREALAGSPKTNRDRLHEDMESAASGVTGTIGKGYEYVRTNVLQPIAEQTKDWFIVGPLIGSISELSPSQIKNAVLRKWYQFLTNAESFGASDSTKFFGKMFFSMADNARQKLAILDIQEVVEDHLAEKKPKERITFNPAMTKEEWKKVRELMTKDPAAVPTKAASVIEQRRKEGVLDIKLSVQDLIRTDTEAQDHAKTERTRLLKEAVVGSESWKAVGVKTVNFSAEETSMTGDALTVLESDLDPSGSPKTETRAAALLAAKTVLTKAEKIVIAKDPKDLVSMNWNLPRTVTLPMKTLTPLAVVNDIVRAPQPDRFSQVEVGPSDAIANDEVQLVTRNGSNVLLAESNPAVLDAIAQGKPRIDTQEGSPKFKYANGDFTLMPTPAPIRTAS